MVFATWSGCVAKLRKNVNKPDESEATRKTWIVVSHDGCMVDFSTHLNEQKCKVPYLHPLFSGITSRYTLQLNQESIDDRY